MAQLFRDEPAVRIGSQMSRFEARARRVCSFLSTADPQGLAEPTWTPTGTLADLQDLIDQFRHQYNTERPHRSLHRRTPAAAYTARPKTGPGEPAGRTHARVRHDKVNNGKITLRHAGTLYSIGLGRRHNGTPVLALVHGLDITITDATTGELLRQLTLDTTRTYQPQDAKQGEP